jgi:ribosomal protein S18 acetylase RimI-like enzyme
MLRPVPRALAGRPYTDRDLPRLQAALAAWRRSVGLCGYCHVGDLPDRIYAGLRGRHPVGDVVRVWELDDGDHGKKGDGRDADVHDVAGIAIALRFDSAFDVFVSPNHRGSEAEVAMLEWAGRATRAHMDRAGRSDQPVVTDVFGCDTVRAALVFDLGYERFRLFDHIAERPLDPPLPNPTLPEGFTVRTATPADADQLAAARNSAFDGGWSAIEYAREVMAKPGYDADREIVAVAPDGRIAAFAVIWLDGLNGVGHFEPVGSHADFRRLGLARAVIVEGFQRMRAAGMRSATVEYDATNAAAAALYARLGFVTRFETFGCRRA